MLPYLVSKNYIPPNLRWAAVHMNKFAEDRQKLDANFSYFVVGGLAAVMQGRERWTEDLDIDISKLGNAEKTALRAYQSWRMHITQRKPSQITAKIAFGNDPKKIKMDAALAKTEPLSIITRHGMLEEVDDIPVASPALMAAIKLQTIAERQNTRKLAMDCIGLEWCLETCVREGLDIPQEALDAVFTAGWDKMLVRLKQSSEDQVFQNVTNLLHTLSLGPKA